MEYEAPAAAGTAVTSELNRDANQSVDSPETVEMECFACPTDRFRFVGLIRHGEARVAGRFRCVGCGATSDRDVTVDGRDA